MHRSFRRSSILLPLFSILVFAAATHADWRNALAPKGTPGAAVEVARDGKSVCTIVTDDEPTEAATKGAADLRSWLKQVTGDAPAIARGGAAGNVIRLRTDASFPPEQYRIDVGPGAITLTGSPGRGVINAVYALLEEDLGCRFYTADSVKLPHDANLKIAAVPRTYCPQLKLRDPFYKVSFDADWSIRNRTNAPDAPVAEALGHIDYGGLFVHTQHALLPPEKFFKDHPEYYQQNPDGQRVPVQICTSNPEARKRVTEAVLETLAKHPHTEVVSVSRLDVQQVCHCAECEKRRTEEGSEMANQLLLVNEVAGAVAKAYPGVMVDTLAYLETLPVPKTMRPAKNVIIRLCNDVPGAWSHPFTPAEQTGTAALVAAWSKVHDKLSIWDYNVNFSHYLAPMPNLDVIAANVRYFAANKAWGIMTQGGYQGAAERDELKSWVIAKLMWDPTRDEQALVEDFVYGHYGPAAPAMMEYEALLAQAAKEHAKDLASPAGGIRYPMDVPFLSRAFVDRATTILAHAKVAAGADDVILRRVERAELPLLYVKLARGPSFDADFARTLVDFSNVAHREGATHLAEVWPANLDATIDAWKKQVPKPATAPSPQATGNSQLATFQVLSNGPAALTYHAFPDVCRLKNGDLLAVFYAGYGHVSVPAADVPLGGRICLTRSIDDGRTWSAPDVLFDDAGDNRDPHVAQLDDGTLLCTFFSFNLKPGVAPLKSSKDFSWKTWQSMTDGQGTQVVFSRDNGHTWDKAATSIAKDWYVSAPVRQLKDGTCVLGLYRESSEKKGNFTVAYGGVTTSNDRGKTWSMPVSIGQDANLPLDAETDVIQLKDGSLFAALRSSKVNMHAARSTDLGRTWSPVVDLGFKGHSPHLYRLSTGEILLSHRLPNTALHVSRDDAKTWHGPFEIDNVIGAYPSCVELADHTVLILYYTEGPGSEIRAKRFHLTKDGIEMVSPK